MEEACKDGCEDNGDKKEFNHVKERDADSQNESEQEVATELFRGAGDGAV